MVVIIGGQPARFRSLIELYRQAGRGAGYSPETMKVGLYCCGFVGDTAQQAADDFYPDWALTFQRSARSGASAHRYGLSTTRCAHPTVRSLIPDPPFCLR